MILVKGFLKQLKKPMFITGITRRFEKSHNAFE
jgi:hypothetical protein